MNDPTHNPDPNLPDVDPIAEGKRHLAADKIDAAVKSFIRAVRIQPTSTEALRQLGLALEKQREFPAAAGAFHRLITVMPDHPDAYNHLGRVNYKLGNVEAAASFFQKALSINFRFPGAQNSLGIVFVRMGRFREAEACFKNALALLPDYAEARFNLAYLRLLQADFEEGWRSYEYRYNFNPALRQRIEPRWDGEAMEGKTLFVTHEQGIGDTIQFMRYLPLVRQRCGRLIFSCPDSLRTLAEGFPGIDAFPATGSPNGLHAAIGLLSLPHIFQTYSDEAVPSSVPYIFPSADKIRQWADVKAEGVCNVGLVWAGNPRHQDDWNRSLHLSQLKSLAEVPDVVFHSLQKGARTEEAERPPEGMALRNNTSRLADFSDTAGLIHHLDLVISVDTAVAHLAGAMGKPVWTLLSFVPDWRWLLERPDTPWYPTMRLFRQRRFKDWSAPIADIARSLGKFAASGPSETPLTVRPPVSSDSVPGDANLDEMQNKTPRCRIVPIESPLHQTESHQMPFQRHLEAGPSRYEDLSRENRFEEAVAAYEAALSVDPDASQAAPDEISSAYVNLALLHLRRGDRPSAVAVLEKAANLVPNAAIFNHLGELYRRNNRLDDAEAMVRQAIDLEPDSASAHANLGAIYITRERYEAAIPTFETALSLKPEMTDARFNLGLTYKLMGRFSEAETAFHGVIERSPGHVGAYVGLGLVLNEQGKHAASESAYRRALEISPDHPEALVGLGIVLKDQRRMDESLAAYQRAAEKWPNHVEAIKGLGVTLKDLGRFDEALAHYDRIRVLQPLNKDILLNIGNCQKAKGDMEAARRTYREAIDADPVFARAHLYYGLLLLLLGEFEEGWMAYEWRWKDTPLVKQAERYAQIPLWDGSPLAGKTILLHGEQGFGDSIQFIRYAPRVAGQGAHVIVECETSLTRLFSHAPGVHSVIDKKSELPPADCHASLMQLARIFNTDATAIPAETPYLAPIPEDAKKWKNRLAGQEGLKIGLVWAGNPKHQKDHLRSIPLAWLKPVLDTPNVRFFSLQKGDRASELADCTSRDRIFDLAVSLNDFADTAAVITALDLVITVDTAVAHLAGALGRPVWTMIQFSPDWRWQIGREDTPWYPTMRLFRQTAHDKWSPVIESVATALREHVEAGGAPPVDTNPPKNAEHRTAMIEQNLRNTGTGMTGVRQCRHGLMLYLKEDQYVGRSLALYGEFSEGETELFRQLIRPGFVVVEAGANIGAHTLFLAKAVGPDGVVLAFEPQRMLHQILCANMALNEITNVHARHMALGDGNGTLYTPVLDYRRFFNFGGVSLNSEKGEPVAVASLDSFNLPRLNLLKADVEGMEVELLRGGAETIRRCRPLLYVENDRRERSSELVELIFSLNYRVWWHKPLLFNPNNFADNPENLFGNIISANLLCVPAESDARISGLAEITGPAGYAI